MSKSNVKRENLWEGKVSIRKNFISVKTRYAIIKEKKIIIRKNENEESKIYEGLSEIIEVNTQLYEFSKEGYISEERIGDFLTLVNKVYEAY